MIRGFFAKEDGRSTLEWAIILVVIAVVVIGVVIMFGNRMSSAP